MAADDDGRHASAPAPATSGWPTTTSTGPAPSSSGGPLPSPARAGTRLRRRSGALTTTTTTRGTRSHERDRDDGRPAGAGRREGHLRRHAHGRARRRPRVGLQAHARRARVRLGDDRSHRTSTSASTRRRSTRTASPYGPELDVTPKDFGRIAAQTARQVMTQRIREAERELQYEEYAGPRGRHRHRHRPAERQPLHAARPRAGRGAAAAGRAGAVRAARGQHPPQGLHRRGAAHVEGPADRRVAAPTPASSRELFELEVPEIADGVVEIKACAREPGHRTKIAVWSNDNNVDPVGACVGARGARVRMVVNELRGEKIDIVPFSDDPSEFVAKALSPAKVKEVRIDEDTGVAEVIVPDYQLSLAIGKEGQNARLSARLTGLARRHQERDPARRGGDLRPAGLGRGRVGRRRRDRRAGVAAGRGRPGPEGRGLGGRGVRGPGRGRGRPTRRGRGRRRGGCGRRGCAEAACRGGRAEEAAPTRLGRGGRRRRPTPTDGPTEDVEAELDAEEAVAEDVAELTETDEEAESAAEAGEPVDGEPSGR